MVSTHSHTRRARKSNFCGSFFIPLCAGCRPCMVIIMQNNEIKVSVCCTVYNHEKYLRKCLDGFIMQKTNFAFEVLVHDDKSTDSSAEIIKEYYEKYPDIIVPFLQAENQYSKNVNILNDILLPMTKGKYIALCDGDDYWCDENKLQLQYDYMESDEECVMCLHNTVWHYLNGGHKDKLLNNWKKIHTLNAEEAFLEYYVHTSAYFIRKKYVVGLDIGRNCYNKNDDVLRTWLYANGKLVSLPQVMSVYNYGVENSFTSLEKKSNSVHKVNLENYIEYLNKLNSKINYKYDKEIKTAINKIKFNILTINHTEKILDLNNKNEIVEFSKKITSDPFYLKYVEIAKKENSRLRYLMFRFKYEGYVVYPIWKLAYSLYYGRKSRRISQ